MKYSKKIKPLVKKLRAFFKEYRLGKILVVSSLALIAFSLLYVAFGYVREMIVNVEVTDVRVTNVSDTGVSITWKTDKKVKGSIIYGKEDSWTPVFNYIGKERAYDDRDIEEYDYGKYRLRKWGEYYVHHVTLRNLEPNAKYYYRISTGYKSVKAESYYPSFETADTLDDLRSPDPIYGLVKAKGNVDVETDALIFLKVYYEDSKSGFTVESAPYSLITTNGSYSFDMNNVRNKYGDKLFADTAKGQKLYENINVEAEGYEDAYLQIDTGEDQPAKTILLKKNEGNAAVGNAAVGNADLHYLRKQHDYIRQANAEETTDVKCNKPNDTGTELARYKECCACGKKKEVVKCEGKDGYDQFHWSKCNIEAEGECTDMCAEEGKDCANGTCSNPGAVMKWDYDRSCDQYGNAVYTEEYCDVDGCVQYKPGRYDSCSFGCENGSCKAAPPEKPDEPITSGGSGGTCANQQGGPYEYMCKGGSCGQFDGDCKWSAVSWDEVPSGECASCRGSSGSGEPPGMGQEGTCPGGITLHFSLTDGFHRAPVPAGNYEVGKSYGFSADEQVDIYFYKKDGSRSEGRLYCKSDGWELTGGPRVGICGESLDINGDEVAGLPLSMDGSRNHVETVSGLNYVCTSDGWERIENPLLFAGVAKSNNKKKINPLEYNSAEESLSIMVLIENIGSDACNYDFIVRGDISQGGPRGGQSEIGSSDTVVSFPFLVEYNKDYTFKLVDISCAGTSYPDVEANIDDLVERRLLDTTPCAEREPDDDNDGDGNSDNCGSDCLYNRNHDKCMDIGGAQVCKRFADNSSPVDYNILVEADGSCTGGRNPCYENHTKFNVAACECTDDYPVWDDSSKQCVAATGANAFPGCPPTNDNMDNNNANPFENYINEVTYEGEKGCTQDLALNPNKNASDISCVSPSGGLIFLPFDKATGKFSSDDIGNLNVTCTNDTSSDINDYECVFENQEWECREKAGGGGSSINIPITSLLANLDRNLVSQVLAKDSTVVNKSGVYEVEGGNVTGGDNEVEVVVSELQDSVEIKFFDDKNENGVKDKGEKYLNAGKFRLIRKQEMMAYELKKGWNLVSFPIISDDVKTAKNLIDKISDSGGYATHVGTYRDGRWTMYSQRNEYTFSENFNLIPGAGYFVRVYEGTTLKIKGQKFAESYPLYLDKGWNLIGVISPEKEYSAERLIDTSDEQDVEMDTVTKWDGRYRSYVKRDELSYGRDFKLFESGGYFVRVRGSGKVEL